MCLFPSLQHQEQHKCIDDTAFVYTSENMGLEEGEKKRGNGQARGGGMEGTDNSLITSFLSIVFFSQLTIVKTTVDKGGSVALRHRSH